jgi:hypothetical protein
MKKILVLLLSTNLVWASSHIEEIQKWVDVKPEKGYILSVDLNKEKMCSKIWTKQIAAFKKMNPHIKNPDMILINQDIKVQDCKVEVQEVILEEIVVKAAEQPKEKHTWFVGVFGGASMLGGTKKDTAKNGYSFGVKVGTERKMGDMALNIAAGFLQNKSRTKDSDNSLGEYEVTSRLFTLEGSLMSSISEKWQLGPKAMIVASKDVSFKEVRENRALGAYLGADALYALSKDLKLDINIQQRIDDLSRFHLLGNIGLRLDF